MANLKKKTEPAAEVTAESVEAKAAEVEPAAEEKVYIYVGASIPGTILTSGRLFRGGLPETAKGLIAQRYPEAAQLVIDVRELPGFRQRAAVKGSHEYELMTRLLNKIKG